MNSTKIQLLHQSYTLEIKITFPVIVGDMRHVSSLPDLPAALAMRDACTARDASPIDEGHVSDAALAHACSHRTAAEIKSRRSETHVERSLAIGYVAGAHRSTDLTYKEMQGPGTIARDASIKGVVTVAPYACAGEVCITLLNRSFVRFIDRKKTVCRSSPDYGYTFIPVSCGPFCTDAGVRNWFELCFYPAPGQQVSSNPPQIRSDRWNVLTAQ
jgi:hypothetical protein